MTSFKQIEANRRNACKSTGPITEEGKQRSRSNAVRHGLTAETVIGALEDAEDYKEFEEAVTAGFGAETAVERELVLRLASLLWRLRRATAIDTALLETSSERNAPPDLESAAAVNERAADGIAQIGVSRTIHRWKAAMIKATMTRSILKSHGGSCSSTAKALSGSDAMKQRCGGKCIR
jgi:hypothetical protein